MSLNEVKLTVAIEDPIKREQKEFMGVEVATFSLPQQQVTPHSLCECEDLRSELSKPSSFLTAALPLGAAGVAHFHSAGDHQESK